MRFPRSLHNAIVPLEDRVRVDELNVWNVEGYWPPLADRALVRTEGFGYRTPESATLRSERLRTTDGQGSQDLFLPTPEIFSVLDQLKIACQTCAGDVLNEVADRIADGLWCYEPGCLSGPSVDCQCCRKCYCEQHCPPNGWASVSVVSADSDNMFPIKMPVGVCWPCDSEAAFRLKTHAETLGGPISRAIVGLSKASPAWHFDCSVMFAPMPDLPMVAARTARGLRKQYQLRDKEKADMRLRRHKTAESVADHLSRMLAANLGTGCQARIPELVDERAATPVRPL